MQDHESEHFKSLFREALVLGRWSLQNAEWGSPAKVDLADDNMLRELRSMTIGQDTDIVRELLTNRGSDNLTFLMTLLTTPLEKLNLADETKEKLTIHASHLLAELLVEGKKNRDSNEIQELRKANETALASDTMSEEDILSKFAKEQCRTIGPILTELGGSFVLQKFRPNGDIVIVSVMDIQRLMAKRGIALYPHLVTSDNDKENVASAIRKSLCDVPEKVSGIPVTNNYRQKYNHVLQIERLSSGSICIALGAEDDVGILARYAPIVTVSKGIINFQPLNDLRVCLGLNETHTVEDWRKVIMMWLDVGLPVHTKFHPDSKTIVAYASASQARMLLDGKPVITIDERGKNNYTLGRGVYCRTSNELPTNTNHEAALERIMTNCS
jgi:hypothetical protein